MKYSLVNRVQISMKIYIIMNTIIKKVESKEKLILRIKYNKQT